VSIEKSIKIEMLIFLLVLTAISISITAYIGINSVRTTGYDAQQITATALSTQSEKFLLQLTEEAAGKNDMMFDKIQKDASNLAAYAANIFDNPEAFARENYWKFDDRVFIGEHGQHMNSMNDTSSLFIPNHVAITDDLKKRVELSAYLDYAFPKFLENEPNAVAVYMIGPEGESRYYPNIGLGDIAPPDLRVTEEIFYTIADPKNNPEKKVVWAPVYDDPAAQGLMITASAPIYTKEGFLGVLGIDLTLNIITKNIEKYNPIENSYSFIIDKEGHAIALPDKAYEDILGRTRISGEFGVNLDNITNEFGSVIKEMKEGSRGFQNISVGNKELYIAYAPLKSTGFSLGIVAEKSVMLKSASDLQKVTEASGQRMIYLYILPIGLFIIVVAWILGFLYVRRIVNPIQRLTEIVKEVSKGNLDIEIIVKSKDEIGELASAFSQMTADLKKYQKQIKRHEEELEQIVSERTDELNKKVKELEENRSAILNMMEDAEEANKELRKTHEKLKKALDEMKNVDVKKDEFISITAHEFKTPLTAIHGFSQLLQNEKIDSESRQKYLKIMKGETERLTKLVTDILDLSRIDLGTFKIDFQDFDIRKFVEDVNSEIRILLAERGLKYSCSIAKDVPETIVTDPERLMQILINLLTNAVKYTPKGSVELNVSKEGDNLHFIVKDTGIGIAKKEFSKLFHRFYQIDSSYTRAQKGSGLGLAVCKELVENMGGKIWINSESGKGSTFHFTLPIEGFSKKAQC
jgi:signal transduction histidine kinase